MIDHAALKFLGIYPETIDEADETCERVCAEYGIDSDDKVWDYVEQDFREIIFDGNLTNFIIDLIFRHTRNALVEARKVEDDAIDWYVNGDDSHFYIDGEQV